MSVALSENNISPTNVKSCPYMWPLISNTDFAYTLVHQPVWQPRSLVLTSQTAEFLYLYSQYSNSVTVSLTSFHHTQ